MSCSVIIKVESNTKDMLESLKIHPRQSFNEVIAELIIEHNNTESKNGVE